jgi:hypothetical protein
MSVDVGAPAGEFVAVTSGNYASTYTATRGNGRVFYTDAEGFKYQCMDFATVPETPTS